MKRLALALRVLAPIPVIVGLTHLALGPNADGLLGSPLGAAAAADAVLASQNRFYGVAFALYGALLWLAATDLRRYATMLRLALGFMFAAGLARILALALTGWPSPLVIGLGLIELVLPPGLWLWLDRALARTPEETR